jgi:hypothetical protein
VQACAAASQLAGDPQSWEGSVCPVASQTVSTPCEHEAVPGMVHVAPPSPASVPPMLLLVLLEVVLLVLLVLLEVVLLVLLVLLPPVVDPVVIEVPPLPDTPVVTPKMASQAGAMKRAAASKAKREGVKRTGAHGSARRAVQGGEVRTACGRISTAASGRTGRAR